MHPCHYQGIFSLIVFLKKTYFRGQLFAARAFIIAIPEELIGLIGVYLGYVLGMSEETRYW